jgi:hypothetical protein
LAPPSFRLASTLATPGGKVTSCGWRLKVATPPGLLAGLRFRDASATLTYSVQGSEGVGWIGLESTTLKCPHVSAWLTLKLTCTLSDESSGPRRTRAIFSSWDLQAVQVIDKGSQRYTHAQASLTFVRRMLHGAIVRKHIQQYHHKGCLLLVVPLTSQCWRPAASP